MEFLTNSRIDFMKYRKVFIVVSLTLLVVSAFELFVKSSLNLGIDFVGGTQLTVRFQERPEMDALRRTLEQAGFRDAQLQRFGDDPKEVLIKTPVVGGSEEGSGPALIAALDKALNPDAGNAVDLNQEGVEAVTGLLVQADPDGLRATGESDEAVHRHYHEVAASVVVVRTENKIIDSWDAVAARDGVTPADLEALQKGATLGSFNVLSTENVGPQIGSELRTKGILAVVMSLLGMLVYIWFRFELRFGVGALVALFHDVVITLGLFALLDYEFNLSTIAAFLTLVGYSVNDTVIVFDRVRENMRRFRRRDLTELMNESLNQTLSRTILTSGTTLLAVGSLFFLGGEVIRGFAFVLLVGIIIGTYSSLYIACPFALLWEQLFGRDTRSARTAKQRQAA